MGSGIHDTDGSAMVVCGRAVKPVWPNTISTYYHPDPVTIIGHALACTCSIGWCLPYVYTYTKSLRLGCGYFVLYDAADASSMFPVAFALRLFVTRGHLVLMVRTWRLQTCHCARENGDLGCPVSAKVGTALQYFQNFIRCLATPRPAQLDLSNIYLSILLSLLSLNPKYVDRTSAVTKTEETGCPPRQKKSTAAMRGSRV